MARTLDATLRERPVDRRRVDAIKRRMVEEVRAQRLRDLREAANLTQVDLAAKLHVSQNRVSRIEHGDIERAQLDTLRKYVEALGGILTVEAQFADERFRIA